MTGRRSSGPDGPNEVAERVAEVFVEALEQPPEKRRAFLESHSSGAVRAEVDSLLAAHEQAGEFLEGLDTVRGAALLDGAVQADGAGRRVGPYRLLRELGRGGMGVVYLAERAEGGFEQRAAVKLVKRGMDSDAILQRFLQERQILAGLDHPGVARLLDGGADEDGRPYFAMEYVEGEPLTRHCDGQRLGIEDRLRLLEEAARAVQYAHGRLVVHRDLKPSNILVTPAGRLKLLDFGVAKLLADDPETAHTALTLPGIRPMTLDYAAPEQVRGEPVSTATDVYALGVVLYELLTGRRPSHAAEGSSPKALATAICEHPPEPPSVAVTRSPAEHALARRLTPQRLAKRLRGDLDTVVLKALAKDPARRYASAEALADDVRRHLGGHPVRARRDSVGYRAAKFVRRHSVGVAAVVVAGLGLLLGLVGTAWQADRARREAGRARAVERFLVGVFERADPTRSLGETVTALQLLDEGARRLRSEPATDPSTRAELADTLARTYRSLGRLDEASAWSRDSAKGFRDALGPLHPRTALAELTEAEVRADRGEIAAARAALDSLLPRLREAYGEGSLEHLRARSARATLLFHTGEGEAALAEQRAVLAATENARGSAVEVAAQEGRVADALANQSRFAEAESAYRQALGRVDAAGGSRSPQAIYLETMLAELLDRAGRADEASVLFRSALEKARGQLGSRHPQVAQILIKYGFLLNMKGRYQEGEAALDEAISILEPLGHYDAAAALGYKGVALVRRERLAEAREAFAHAERIHRAKLGDDDPMTWWAVMNLAYTDARLGKIEEGEARLREAIAALERLHGAESNDVRAPRKYLGEVLRLAGRTEEAEAIHRACLDLERRLFGGEDTLASASTKHHIALDLLESGRSDRLGEARRLAEDSLAFLRAHPQEPGRHGEVLTTVGRIAAAQGDPAAARMALAEALLLLPAARGEDAPSTRAARRALAALPR